MDLVKLGDPLGRLKVLPLVLAAMGALCAQAPLQGPPQAVPQVGGALLVAPTRLVFDDRKRTGEVNLNNTGNGAGRYRIYLMRMEMDENGGFRELPLDRTPGQVAVQDMIRFSPREVSLDAREGQVVRIQVRRPADLPAGEYRLHMVFREEPAQAPEPPAGQEPPKGLSIHLTSLFGVAIPIIIRHGATSATVALAGLELDASRRNLKFRLERSGNQSVHGDLKATFLAKGGKGPLELAELNGISVFTPNAFRNMVLPLGPGAQGEGRIRVTFSAPEDQGGAVMAEGSLEVH